MTITRRGAAEAMSTGSPDVSEEESTTAVPAKHKASSRVTKGTRGASSQGKATSSSASKSKKALTVSPEQYAEFLKIQKAQQKGGAKQNLSCGSSDDIKEKVTWLLTASNFLYGDLDIKAKTLNSSKPFGNAFIKDLIQVIWFNMTKGGSKAEAMTTKFIYHFKTWKGLVKKSKKWMDMQSCSDLSHLLEDEDEVNEEEIKDINTTDLNNIADNGMDIF
ncbi:hypothetical protein CPB84DRAFT_1742872 [Gymnopilus junonius]|uniref:DUF6532 domain-containing protein n=1 Tax=Gymnopilus junonius TaxID=109634 RepID=A0A9P5TUG1_GYMJU|nr:hypothetical protein CPB84DRAFT_1742872 [Gymnopilus junonius]